MRARILAAFLITLAGLTGCIKGTKQFVYVTGQSSNEVFGFHQNGDGSLSPMGNPNFGTGSQPTSVVIHSPGDFAYISNFAGDNVTLLAVNKGNGELTVPVSNLVIAPPTPPNIFNTGTGPIAMAISPTDPFLYVLNQGSATISAFTIDPGTGDLGLISGPAVSTPAAPQSIAISPKGNFVFVANPAAGTVSVFAVSTTAGSKGALSAVGAPVSMGTGATPNFVTVDASGRFLYVADPAHNAVLGFAIQSGGTLAAIAGSPFTAGAQPTALASDPQGSFLFAANSGSNNVSAYVIDSNTGALGQTSGSPFATGGTGPGFVAAIGGYVYVADQTSNDVAAFLIGPAGQLTKVNGSPFNVAVSPAWIAAISE
jgi:6-phosphogluconolactonase (cycloisomerase 2 family)